MCWEVDAPVVCELLLLLFVGGFGDVSSSGWWRLGFDLPVSELPRDPREPDGNGNSPETPGNSPVIIRS